MPYAPSLLDKYKDWKIGRDIDRIVEKMDSETRKTFCLECYMMSSQAGNIWSIINTPNSGQKEIPLSISDIMMALKNQNFSNEYREIQQILEKYSKEGSNLYFNHKMNEIESRLMLKYSGNLHLH